MDHNIKYVTIPPQESKGWGIVVVKFQIHLHQINPKVSHLKDLKQHYSQMYIGI
jgi:hypothetical protein